MQITSFMNVLEEWTFKFVKVPVQRVCSTDHNSFDSNDNETQECLYEQNWPHVVYIVDSAIFGRETHIAFGEKGIHLWTHDHHTSDADSLHQKQDNSIQLGISIDNRATGSIYKSGTARLRGQGSDSQEASSQESYRILGSQQLLECRADSIDDHDDRSGIGEGMLLLPKDTNKHILDHDPCLDRRETERIRS